MFISFVFGLTALNPQFGYAQTMPALPSPPALSVSASGRPVLLKGMTIHPDKPFQFDFILDPGDSGLATEQLAAETQKLVKYFLAALTVPEDEMWVNLNPKEADRIVARGLGETDMGRDMLAQDFLLKQMAASLLNPESETGARMWERIYARAGTRDIPVDFAGKVWIVPEESKIYVHEHNVFVVSSRLKVMMEREYLSARETRDKGQETGEDCESMSSASCDLSPRARDVSTQIMKDALIPALEHEVNHGPHFAQLRQIFHSMILATWYKQNLKQSLLTRHYAGQNKITGIDIDDKDAAQKIYEQYLDAFRKGVYDMIKEEYDPAAQEVVSRKYVTGGVDAAMIGGTISTDTADTAALNVRFKNDPWRARVTLQAPDALADKAIAKSRDILDDDPLTRDAAMGDVIRTGVQRHSIPGIHASVNPAGWRDVHAAPDAEDIEEEFIRDLEETDLGRRLQRVFAEVDIHALDIRLNQSTEFSGTIYGFDATKRELIFTVGVEEGRYLEQFVHFIVHATSDYKQGFYVVYDEFFRQGILVNELDNTIHLSDPVDVPFYRILAEVSRRLGLDHPQRLLPAPGEDVSEFSLGKEDESLWDMLDVFSPGYGGGHTSKKFSDGQRKDYWISFSTGFRPSFLNAGVFDFARRLKTVEELKGVLEIYSMEIIVQRRPGGLYSLAEDELVYKHLVKAFDVFPDEIQGILNRLSRDERAGTLDIEELRARAEEIFSKLTSFNAFMERFLYLISTQGFFDDAEVIKARSVQEHLLGMLKPVLDRFPAIGMLPGETDNTTALVSRAPAVLAVSTTEFRYELLFRLNSARYRYERVSVSVAILNEWIGDYVDQILLGRITGRPVIPHFIIGSSWPQRNFQRMAPHANAPKRRDGLKRREYMVDHHGISTEELITSVERVLPRGLARSAEWGVIQNQMSTFIDSAEEDPPIKEEAEDAPIYLLNFPFAGKRKDRELVIKQPALAKMVRRAWGKGRLPTREEYRQAMREIQTPEQQRVKYDKFDEKGRWESGIISLVVEHESVRRAVSQSICSVINPGDRVLFIAEGQGQLARQVMDDTNSLDVRIEAVDINGGNTEKANNLGVDQKVADAYRLQEIYTEPVFDVGVVNEGAGSFDLDKLLNTVKPVLKPGATLMITVTPEEDIMWTIHQSSETEFMYYSLSDIIDGFQRNGFTDARLAAIPKNIDPALDEYFPEDENVLYVISAQAPSQGSESTADADAAMIAKTITPDPDQTAAQNVYRTFTAPAQRARVTLQAPDARAGKAIAESRGSLDDESLPRDAAMSSAAAAPLMTPDDLPTIFSKYRIAIPEKFRGEYYASDIKEELERERNYRLIKVHTQQGEGDVQVDETIPESVTTQWAKLYSGYAKTAAQYLKKKSGEQREIKIIVAEKSPYLLEYVNSNVIVMNAFFIRFFQWLESEDELASFEGITVKTEESSFWATGNERYDRGDITAETGKIIEKRRLRETFHVLTMPLFYAAIEGGLAWQDVYKLFDQIDFDHPNVYSIDSATKIKTRMPFSFYAASSEYSYGSSLRDLWEVWGAFLEDMDQVEYLFNPNTANNQLNHKIVYEDRSDYFRDGYKNAISDVRRFRWTMEDIKRQIEILRQKGHRILSANPEFTKFYLGSGQVSWAYFSNVDEGEGRTEFSKWKNEWELLENLWGAIFALQFTLKSLLNINFQELHEKDYGKSWRPEERLVAPGSHGGESPADHHDAVQHLREIFLYLSVIRWGNEEDNPTQSLYGLPAFTLAHLEGKKINTISDYYQLEDAEGLTEGVLDSAFDEVKEELGDNASEKELIEQAVQKVAWREAPTLDNVRTFVEYLYAHYDPNLIRQAIFGSFSGFNGATEVDRSGQFKPFHMRVLSNSHRIFEDTLWLVNENIKNELQENGYPLPWMGMLFGTDGKVDPYRFEGMQVFNVRPVYFDTQFVEVLSEIDPEFINQLIAFLEEKSQRLGLLRSVELEGDEKKDYRKQAYTYQEPVNYLFLIRKHYPELFEVMVQVKPSLREEVVDLSKKRKYVLSLREKFRNEGGFQKGDILYDMQGLNIFNLLDIDEQGRITSLMPSAAMTSASPKTSRKQDTPALEPMEEDPDAVTKSRADFVQVPAARDGAQDTKAADAAMSAKEFLKEYPNYVKMFLHWKYAYPHFKKWMEMYDARRILRADLRYEGSGEIHDRIKEHRDILESIDEFMTLLEQAAQEAHEAMVDIDNIPPEEMSRRLNVFDHHLNAGMKDYWSLMEDLHYNLVLMNVFPEIGQEEVLALPNKYQDMYDANIIFEQIDGREFSNLQRKYSRFSAALDQENMSSALRVIMNQIAYREILVTHLIDESEYFVTHSTELPAVKKLLQPYEEGETREMSSQIKWRQYLKLIQGMSMLRGLNQERSELRALYKKALEEANPAMGAEEHWERLGELIQEVHRKYHEEFIPSMKNLPPGKHWTGPYHFMLLHPGQAVTLELGGYHSSREKIPADTLLFVLDEIEIALQHITEYSQIDRKEELEREAKKFLGRYNQAGDFRTFYQNKVDTVAMYRFVANGGLTQEKIRLFNEIKNYFEGLRDKIFDVVEPLLADEAMTTPGGEGDLAMTSDRPEEGIDLKVAEKSLKFSFISSEVDGRVQKIAVEDQDYLRAAIMQVATLSGSADEFQEGQEVTVRPLAQTGSSRVFRIDTGGRSYVLKRAQDGFINEILDNESIILFELNEEGQREDIADSVFISKEEYQLNENYSEGLAFHVTRFFSGETLQDMVDQNGALTERQAIQLALNLARTVAYVHEQGVIARELKPANIIIRDNKMRVGLFDFGVSLLPDYDWDRDRLHLGYYVQHMYDETGFLRVFQRRRPDVQSDIYTMGLVVLFALTGEYEFEGAYSREDDDLIAIAEEREEIIQSKIKLVENNKLRDVIRHSVSVREERYKNVKEFIKALEKAEIADPAMSASTPNEADVSDPAMGILTIINIGLIAFLGLEMFFRFFFRHHQVSKEDFWIDRETEIEMNEKIQKEIDKIKELPLEKKFPYFQNLLNTSEWSLSKDILKGTLLIAEAYEEIPEFPEAFLRLFLERWLNFSYFPFFSPFPQNDYHSSRRRNVMKAKKGITNKRGVIDSGDGPSGMWEWTQIKTKQEGSFHLIFHTIHFSTSGLPMVNQYVLRDQPGEIMNDFQDLLIGHERSQEEIDQNVYKFLYLQMREVLSGGVNWKREELVAFSVLLWQSGEMKEFLDQLRKRRDGIDEKARGAILTPGKLIPLLEGSGDIFHPRIISLERRPGLIVQYLGVLEPLLKHKNFEELNMSDIQGQMDKMHILNNDRKNILNLHAYFQSSDRAMISDNTPRFLEQKHDVPSSKQAPGGIDMNPAHMDMQTDGAMIDVAVPDTFDEFQNMQINGFVPVIHSITPVMDLPFLLGLDDLPKEEEERLAQNVDLIAVKD